MGRLPGVKLGQTVRYLFDKRAKYLISVNSIEKLIGYSDRTNHFKASNFWYDNRVTVISCHINEAGVHIRVFLDFFSY